MEEVNCRTQQTTRSRTGNTAGWLAARKCNRHSRKGSKPEAKTRAHTERSKPRGRPRQEPGICREFLLVLRLPSPTIMKIGRQGRGRLGQGAAGTSDTYPAPCRAIPRCMMHGNSGRREAPSAFCHRQNLRNRWGTRWPHISVAALFVAQAEICSWCHHAQQPLLHHQRRIAASHFPLPPYQWGGAKSQRLRPESSACRLGCYAPCPSSEILSFLPSP